MSKDLDADYSIGRDIFLESARLGGGDLEDFVSKLSDDDLRYLHHFLSKDDNEQNSFAGLLLEVCEGAAVSRFFE